MENWIKYFLLASCLLSSNLFAQSLDQDPVIEPAIERRTVTTPKIDSENFEVGFYYGVLAIEDFDSSDVIGLRAAWHLSEDFFVEANAAQAEGDLTSYEELSGGTPLFSDDDRDYQYYNINIGWNLFPGEVFISDQWAMNTSVYLIAGVGRTTFLGDDWLTVNYGAGFRLLLNDWISWHLDVRDHVFDRDSFGQDETTHNLEFTTGFTVFF